MYQQYIVLSAMDSGFRTAYGPFASIEEATAWRNETVDPNTPTSTKNIVIPLVPLTDFRPYQ